MVKESIISKMEEYIKVNGFLIECKDMENYTMQVVRLHIKVIGFKIIFMVKENFSMKIIKS